MWGVDRYLDGERSGFVWPIFIISQTTYERKSLHDWRRCVQVTDHDRKKNHRIKKRIFANARLLSLIEISLSMFNFGVVMNQAFFAGLSGYW